MLSIVGMFKITLHVKAVARRNIFLLGAVGHGVLPRRHIAHGKLRRAGLGRDLHACLFLETAGLERDSIRNRVHGMRLLILAQFFGALLAPRAFARSLRGFLLGVGTSSRFAALVALRRAGLVRIARLRRALAVRRLLVRAIARLLVRRIRHHIFQRLHERLPQGLAPLGPLLFRLL